MLNTDHEWRFRRVTESGTPIIPTTATAQIRSITTEELWLDLAPTIDPVTGWITIIILHTAVKESAWNMRYEANWDLLVTVSGKKYRWIEGFVSISESVTEYV
jgi:hypothetical protein